MATAVPVAPSASKSPTTRIRLPCITAFGHEFSRSGYPGQASGWKHGAKIKRQFFRPRDSTRQQDALEYRVKVITQPVFTDAVFVDAVFGDAVLIDINRALANGGLPGHAGKLEKQFLPSGRR